MNIIEKLPWYDSYIQLIENGRLAEREIEDIKNPEKQLQRVKKFYQNLGADYLKNYHLAQMEKNILADNYGENNQLNQLKKEMKLGKVVENAVNKMDEESITALSEYLRDEYYGSLVKQIWFYIGMSSVKTDPELIEKACNGLEKRYPLNNASLFREEGVHYYIFYLQCLKECLEIHQKSSVYENVKEKIKERRLNLYLKFKPVTEDDYIGGEIKRILAEIKDLESFILDMESAETVEK